MNNSLKTLIAETHTAEYLIHKYWSRKPHNILRSVFETTLPKNGGVFVDPFCGSGVSLVEAAKLGADVYGADINPAAALLSKNSVFPADPVKVNSALERLINEYERRFSQSLSLKDGEVVRYVVHGTQVECRKCSSRITLRDCKKDGKRTLCKVCGERVYLNLQSAIGFKVLQVKTISGDVYDIDGSPNAVRICAEQEKAAAETYNVSPQTRKQFERVMIANRRLLVFHGMKVSDLFTPRAHAAASWLFNQVHEYETGDVKDACLTFLTSCLAQFSRLIPYRNDLTTGGPAWSVPGFWVAPIHLETNPAIHLNARRIKFIRGLDALSKVSARGGNKSKVYCQDARKFLVEVKRKDIRADIVFLDPPYGDSVPFLEFSEMWNTFINKRPDYEQEIVISDREEMAAGLKEFEARLADVIQGAGDLLKPEGRIILTFNNLSFEVWYAILNAFRTKGLYCEDAFYMQPAVISSKAQFSPDSSYVGDLYGIFSKKKPSNLHVGGLREVRSAINQTLRKSEGILNRAVMQRVAITTILKRNIPPELLYELENLLDSYDSESCDVSDKNAVDLGGSATTCDEQIAFAH